MKPPVRVCFVCSGNICRSPTAEVVLRALAERAGLGDLVEVDSAGTGDWHLDEDMDGRSREALEAGGYTPARHFAKQFDATQFDEREVVVALDTGHHNVLWWLAADTADPAASRAKIVQLRAFDPQLRPGTDPDVGDPYYGGDRGFTEVLEQVERSCAQLLTAIAQAVDSGAENVRPDAAQQEDNPLL